MNLKQAFQTMAVAAGVLAMAGCSLPPLFTTSSSTGSDVLATQVVRVVPATLPAETVAGTCWVNALSVARADAWRCMTENGAIYDPCFATPASLGEQAVVCGIDPVQGTPGFTLALTEPLPAPQVSGSLLPWLIELENGVICRAVTGSRPGVGEKLVNYACDDLNYLIGDLQQGMPWTAESAGIASTDQGFVANSTTTARIRTAWQ